MKKLLRGVLLVALVFSALAMGCKKAEPLGLSGTDSGSQQTVKVGQTVKITLEANPTTGYDWAIDGKVPGQLKQVGKPEFKAASNLAGAGGTEVWTFEATSAGKGELKLKYWRSFEPSTPAIKEYTTTFSVE